MSYLDKAKALEEYMVSLRRHFHQHPEKSMEERETTAFIMAQLNEIGIPHRKLSPSGVVAEIAGGRPGKTVALRADMDALTIQEETGLPFASEAEGLMHACGHDLHMAMLLGAAKLLKEHEDEIEGTVKICFQPNEETFGGAKAMIEAGVLENPHVDAAFAIHVGSMADVGTLDYGKGLTMGSADGFSIHVKGKGCHGAAPNSGISPINIGVHIYLALQELLAREVNPAEQCTLTVGSMLFGDGATNVIPSEGVLNGTMRGFNAELINHLRQRVEEISVGTARVFGGDAEVEWLFSSPAMYCDPEFTDEVVRYAADVVGQDRMIPKKSRATGSEDFAYFGEKVPSQIFWLGAGVDDKTKRISNHNPKVLFSEDALPYGAAVYTQCAIEWLKEHK